jgi:putative ABC transport system permease protein
MLLQLQQLLPRKFGVVAVRPAETMQRLFEQLLEPLERVLLTYGFAVELAAAALILTTLYLSTLVRNRELAMLRALGALPVEIFALVLLEAVVLLILGAGCGVLLAQIATAALGADLEGRFGLETRLFQFSPGELAALAAMFGLSLLAAIMPAWHAYRRDVAIALKG